MNVYSVRFIPSLKIKLCQFLGIASVMAVDELSLRLESLERKLDRLDSQLRRSAPRALPLVTGRVSAKSVKKKSVSLRKAAGTAPLKKKRTELKSLPPPATMAEVDRLSPEPLAVEAAVPPETSIAAELPEAIVLMQADENTRRSVREFFGEGVLVLEAAQLSEAAAVFDSHRVLALLFDRALLGQNEFRSTLEILAQLHPEARIIGLSSYLTLALADSMPQREDFATFLTRPLSVEALAGIFGSARRQAIS